MPGSPFQNREYRKSAVGIGCHIHVEMVAEEIAFPKGVPSPVAVGLGIMTLAAAGRTAVLLTIASSFFPLLCGSADRGTVTGKCQMLRMDQSSVDGLIQKLVFVKLENKKKGIFRFQVPTFQQRKKFGSYTGRITRGLITFLCPFRRLHFRETVFGRKIIPVILPDTGKEIIKGSDTGSISKSETTKDCIKGSFPEHAAHQLVMEVTFSFKARR